MQNLESLMTYLIISCNWVPLQYGIYSSFCSGRTEAIHIKSATKFKILKVSHCALIYDNFYTERVTKSRLLIMIYIQVHWMFGCFRTVSVSVFMQKRTRYHNSEINDEWLLFYSRRRMNHFLRFHFRFSHWAHWSCRMTGNVNPSDRETKPSYRSTCEYC